MRQTRKTILVALIVFMMAIFANACGKKSSDSSSSSSGTSFFPTISL